MSEAQASPALREALKTRTAPAAKAHPADAAGHASRRNDVPPPEVKPISPEKFELADQKRNQWMTVVPADTRPEDLDLNPAPFSLVASLLTKGDDIRAFTADDSRMFDLVVVRSANGLAVCRVTGVLDLPKAGEYAHGRVPPTHEVVPARSGDSQPGWLVWRKADGVLLNAGHTCPTEESAIRFLHDHSTMRGNVPQSVHRTFG